MKRLRAAAAIILVLLLLCAALPCAVLAAGEGESHETTVLFTLPTAESRGAMPGWLPCSGRSAPSIPML